MYQHSPAFFDPVFEKIYIYVNSKWMLRRVLHFSFFYRAFCLRNLSLVKSIADLFEIDAVIMRGFLHKKAHSGAQTAIFLNKWLRVNL